MMLCSQTNIENNMLLKEIKKYLHFRGKDSSINTIDYNIFLSSVRSDVCIIFKQNYRSFRIQHVKEHDGPWSFNKIDLCDDNGLSVLKEYLDWESEVDIEIFHKLEDK
jgi:hypothetical protein